jgi:hypothetical protein
MLRGDTDLDTGEETSDPMDFASFFVDGSKKKKKKVKGKSNKSKIRVKPASTLGTAGAGKTEWTDKHFNNGPITDNAYDYAKKYYVDVRYDNCFNGDSELPSRAAAILALAAAAFSPESAAQISAIWGHESGLATSDIYGDAGPAQLTTWWKRNHPDLIVGNAYGNWKGRTYIGKDPPWEGSIRDNIATLRNIVYFLNDRHGSFEQAAYWYGPGDPANPANAANNRSLYTKDVVRRYEKLKLFFDCIHQ